MKLSNFSDHFLKRGHNLETVISKTAEMGFQGIDIGICLPAENDLLAISRWDTDKAYRKKILELSSFVPLLQVFCEIQETYNNLKPNTYISFFVCFSIENYARIY